MLSDPGSGKEGFESLAGYKLRDGSPCLRAGTPISNNGGRDFWGNALPAGNAAPTIGAHEPANGK